MDALDVVLDVERGIDPYENAALMEGIREHKDMLRNLQGFWGRLIAQLESEDMI